MGLKSSPYHLKRFVEVFSQEAYNTFSKELTNDKQDLLPGSFADIIISYFDDCFIFADTYEQLFAVFKLFLLVKAGTAVAQLLVIKSKIPDFEIGWKELDNRDGSFGSTGHNFDKVVSSNTFDTGYSMEKSRSPL